MTTLLKKDYQYSSVLWEEVMQRVQEIIRDEYNISPYVAPTLNPKTPSPFRIWTQAQGTETLYGGAWHKEYTISVNHYLKTEDSERFYKKVYEESERLYQLFFNNQGTKSTQILGFFGGEPQGMQITQENDYFRIEVLFDCQVFRADDVIYVVTAPSEIRARTRALQSAFNFWSLDFDGTDDFINAGSDSSFDTIFDSGGTISMWINVHGLSADNERLVDKKKGGTNGWFWSLKTLSGSTCKLFFNQDFTGAASDDYETTTNDFVINLNQWHNVVLQYNNSSYTNRASMYVDGVLVGLNDSQTPSSGKTAENTATNDLQIGGQLSSDGSSILTPFDGVMSEVAIFNSVLSSSAISTIYNNGQPLLLNENQGSYKSSANLVAYYRMGSGQSDARGYIGEGTTASPFIDNVIFDQINTGVEDELISTIDFNDTDTWFSNNPSYAVSVTSANTFNGNQDLSTYSVKAAVVPGGAIYRFHIEGNVAHGTVIFDEWGGQSSIWAYDKNDVTHAALSGDFNVVFYALNVNGGLMFNTNANNHSVNPVTLTLNTLSIKKVSGNPGKMLNFDSLDFRTNVPQIYDKALFSNSLQFDGVDEHIDIGDKTTSLQSNGFTFSAWIYPHDLSNTQFFISGDENENNIRFNGNGYQLFFEINNKGTTIGTWSSDSDGVFVINQWQHLVVTYDNGTVTIYRNGNPVTFDTGGTTYSTDTGATEFKYRHIGKRYGVASYYDGGISDMAIYNTDLDATNVTAIYNSGKPIDLTCDAGNYNNANNLVAYWKMGDGYLDELPSATNRGGIFDQVTPIIGDDVLSHDINDWAIGHNSGATSTKAYADGVYTVIRESEGTGTAYTYIIQSGTVENNTPYKVNFSYKSTVQLEYTGDYDTASTRLYDATTEYVEITEYIITSATYVGKFQIRAVGNFELKNLTFKKVEGNPGLAKNMNASAQSISVPE